MTRAHLFKIGLVQWRQAAMQRRGVAPAIGTRAAPALPVRARPYYQLAAAERPAGDAPTIRIGEFVISPEGDPRILGHPQIRY